MPWHYFDGKLFQEKYVQRTFKSVTSEQLCNDKVSIKLLWVIKCIDSCHHCPFKVLSMTCNAVFEGTDLLLSELIQ